MLFRFRFYKGDKVQEIWNSQKTITLKDGHEKSVILTLDIRLIMLINNDLI